MTRTPSRILGPLGPLALVAEAEERRGNSVAVELQASRRPELAPVGRARHALDREALEREVELSPDFEWVEDQAGVRLRDRYTGVTVHGGSGRGLLARLRRDPEPPRERTPVAWQRTAPAGPGGLHAPGTWATIGAEEWAVARVADGQVHLATVAVDDDAVREVPDRTVGQDEVDRIFQVAQLRATVAGAEVRVEGFGARAARVSTADAAVARAHDLHETAGRWVGTVPLDRLEDPRSELVEWSRDPETGAWR
ncbi:hypothetical protein [Nocardioides marmoribigeumensis]|uniref:Uncharacterized protein n=1 Tax=Nocardioides marmoribigeumensis TaxID=433649 RepID=A0ABU2BXL7_9ACTN|nr:hypothetical protein [Nocardioides marmoribigeumensis]MDR7363134.1 hypothetical protein [Nocardioides marmoribigeumensis]